MSEKSSNFATKTNRTMALYLKTAIFVNRAPFENLKLDLLENGINVLSAINGKGKTAILSHITDAFYELAKKTFHNEFEGKENKYYRISSPLYNIDFSSPSFVYLRFKLDVLIISILEIIAQKNNIMLQYKLIQKSRFFN